MVLFFQSSTSTVGRSTTQRFFERKTDEELALFFEGLGWKPIFADVTAISDDHAAAHALFAEKLDEAIEEIKKVQAEARKGSAEEATQPVYPVLIARIPKGWTGPKLGKDTNRRWIPCPPSSNPSRCSPHGACRCPSFMVGIIPSS